MTSFRHRLNSSGKIIYKIVTTPNTIIQQQSQPYNKQRQQPTNQQHTAAPHVALRQLVSAAAITAAYYLLLMLLLKFMQSQRMRCLVDDTVDPQWGGNLKNRYAIEATI